VRVAAVAAVLAALVAGCSGGGSDDDAEPVNRASPCELVARLDTIAASVARIDVADPAESQKQIDAAIAEYVSTVRALRDVAPGDLQTDLDRVESAVQQSRFEDAAADRASLDAYAARNCGRSATTATSGSNSVTSTAVVRTTTTTAPR
jgi:hypothetical protein